MRVTNSSLMVCDDDVTSGCKSDLELNWLNIYVTTGYIVLYIWVDLWNYGCGYDKNCNIR